MKIVAKREMPTAEADMTPMIDMTFQLIAFFMVLINFSDAETNERIKLPSSELAKPPDAPLEQPITLQLTREGTVLYAGDEVPVPKMRTPLQRERGLLERLKKPVSGATIIIRADAETKTGVVQELIKIAQEVGFEKFVMRAMQEEDPR
jgi:biopolymer transport protein ExbD